MTRRSLLLTPTLLAAAQAPKFQWPNNKQAALSLSFDDSRLSQIDTGVPFLNKRNAKATFYVLSSTYLKRLRPWKAALAAGHEIAHHTKAHPCTANYGIGGPDNALEDYTLERLARDLDSATDEIQTHFGVKPTSFAYPCGQKFVGRGANVHSYVPLIAKRFATGRGYLDEAANNPNVCDLSALMGTGFDNLTFPQMKALLDTAAKGGRWIIFAGHEMSHADGRQTTNLDALGELIDYARANNIWLDTVANIGQYVHKTRAATAAAAR
ncbi:MAG TPA: polysaccharide deacetylase family protein [Bryobacteraceae bacterium]|nr:polysaccharide deacetylase family protein [Bryobacteraceae bacterium]